MADFWLAIFIVALLANAYCMVKFWQALQVFTKSQRELVELMDRLEKPDR